MHYKQLTREERYQIFALLKMGHNQIEIANSLEKDKSTISREIKRNSGKYSYHPSRAHKKAMGRRQSGRHKVPENVWMLVADKIRQELSPEQVSGWMKRNEIYLLSHEAIYQYIYRDKQKGGNLYCHLRRHKTRRKRTGSYEVRGRLKNRVSIEQRPAEVEKRERIGDWEVDTIIGRKQQQAIVSMVERRTRFTILAKVVKRTSEAVSVAMMKKMIPYRDHILTITSDNGHEFAGHEAIARELEAEYYFAHPYSSWERGTNENTNGLIRQYIPKATDFDTVPDFALEWIMDRLNHRPRKCLGFRTPHEVFHEQLVALQC
jgi:IS30 family transposase